MTASKQNQGEMTELTPSQVSDAKARFAEMDAHYAKIKAGYAMDVSQIEAGMKVTVYVGSDRYIYEVVSKTAATVKIARGSNEYSVRKDTKGKWRVLRQKFPVCFDHADEYMDPSF